MSYFVLVTCEQLTCVSCYFFVRSERACSQQDSYEDRGKDFGDIPADEPPHQVYRQARRPDLAFGEPGRNVLQDEPSPPVSSGWSQPAECDYPPADLKEYAHGRYHKDGADSRDEPFESSAKEKGFDSDCWRSEAPLKKEGGVQSQWSDPGSSSSVGSQPPESSGRTLTRRTGPIKKPVLKALKVEDKENEKPKAEPEEKPVPYRLEKEVLTNVYDLKKDASQPLGNRHSVAPVAAPPEEKHSPVLAKVEKAIAPNEDPLECRDPPESREPPAPRRNNWIFIDEEQAFGGARGTGRGRGRGFREFNSRGGGRGGRGGENPRGGYGNNVGGAQRGGRGRGLREFGKPEDAAQRGKPRRRNVSETLSETSEYEELPKRRRQKGSENGEAAGYPESGGARKVDNRDSWRSNKVYTDDQGSGGESRDKSKSTRGFGRSLPPRLTNSGYTRGFGSREMSSWRGRGGQFGSGPAQENGYGLGTETFQRRPLDREPMKYGQKYSGPFAENGVDDRGGEGGDYYFDGDNPDNRPLRRRRPPRQDKPPRFRRLRQEREPGGQWNGEEYVNGDFASHWTARPKGGEDGAPVHHPRGRSHQDQAEDWETGSDNSEFNDRQDRRGGTSQADVPSDSGHGELGGGEKRELSKRSFSSQRPLVDRQNRKGDPAILEGGKLARPTDTSSKPASSGRGDGWQNGMSPNSKR